MAEKRTSETTAPPESGHETRFLDSEDEGITVLRNYRSRHGHYVTDRRKEFQLLTEARYSFLFSKMS